MRVRERKLTDYSTETIEDLEEAVMELGRPLEVLVVHFYS